VDLGLEFLLLLFKLGQTRRLRGDLRFDGSFFAWPMSMPIFFDRLLRSARRFDASLMAARLALSSSITSSTSGSLAS